MKHEHERCVSSCSLPRTSSCKSTTHIIPANYLRSTTFSVSPQTSDHPDHSSTTFFRELSRTRRCVSHFLRSILSFISFRSLILPTCNSNWLTAVPKTHLRSVVTPSLGRKVTGTLFGRRRGHVSFVVQDHPRSNSNLSLNPLLVIEFAVSTSTLVKEMSSGLVRIGLECEKRSAGREATRLLGEPVWSMYCNGKKCGPAVSRDCTESDLSVLSTVQSISVGAGVIPAEDDGKKGGDCEGELLYMRARFERVIGSRDSEAFYMLNPDGSAGGPELSIFFLRI